MPLAKLGIARSRLEAQDLHRCGASPWCSQANPSSNRQAFGLPQSDQRDPQPRSASARRSGPGPRADQVWVCVCDPIADRIGSRTGPKPEHGDGSVFMTEARWRHLLAVLHSDHCPLAFGHTAGAQAGRRHEGEGRNADIPEPAAVCTRPKNKRGHLIPYAARYAMRPMVVPRRQGPFFDAT